MRFNKMATMAVPTNAPLQAAGDIGGSLRYVARQPILDQRGKVHGYELLFRAGLEAAFTGDQLQATRTVLDNTVLFGFERLTGGLTGFINCSEEALLSDLVEILPKQQAVLELQPDVSPSPEVIARCQKLKADGFRIALDHFVWKAEIKPLVLLADYVKVDVLETTPAQRNEVTQHLLGAKCALVAIKVETQESYQKVKEEGFTLFQGSYFCRPVLLKGRNVPASQISHLRILKMLHEDELDLRKLSELVKQDVSLTYRLLRLVNSPLCAIRQEVRSVETALLAVGEDNFRHIATLAIASELSANQSPEVLRMAFVRARFCELSAEQGAMTPGEQYLLGLLSLLSAMLRVAMEEIIPTLPLREPIRQALLGNSNRERRLLDWLESHECASWTACDAIARSHNLDHAMLMHNYAEAVLWAEQAMSVAH